MRQSLASALATGAEAVAVLLFIGGLLACAAALN